MVIATSDAAFSCSKTSVQDRNEKIAKEARHTSSEDFSEQKNFSDIVDGQESAQHKPSKNTDTLNNQDDSKDHLSSKKAKDLQKHEHLHGNAEGGKIDLSASMMQVLVQCVGKTPLQAQQKHHIAVEKGKHALHQVGATGLTSNRSDFEAIDTIVKEMNEGFVEDRGSLNGLRFSKQPQGEKMASASIIERGEKAEKSASVGLSLGAAAEHGVPSSVALPDSLPAASKNGHSSLSTQKPAALLKNSAVNFSISHHKQVGEVRFLRLSLEPKSLGRVDAQMRLEKGRLHIVLTTHTKEAAHILSSEHAHMCTVLAKIDDRGATETRLTVHHKEATTLNAIQSAPPSSDSAFSHTGSGEHNRNAQKEDIGFFQQGSNPHPHKEEGHDFGDAEGRDPQGKNNEKEIQSQLRGSMLVI